MRVPDFELNSQPAIRPAEADATSLKPARQRLTTLHLCKAGKRHKQRLRYVNSIKLKGTSQEQFTQGSCLILVLQFSAMLSLVCNVDGTNATTSNGGNVLSLNVGGMVTICRGSTSWVNRDCQMLSSDPIPVLSVGMFDSAGKPCCGENQVALRIQVTKGVKEYALSGFVDKDSTTGAFMTVEFTNLKLVDNTAVGEFNVTVSTFYSGVPVKYTVPLRILPSSISLLPWGSWTSQVQFLPDMGPWSVHEALPPFHVVLQAGNVARTINDERFIVGVRLFRPVDFLDITATNLEGTTIQQARQGIAVFNGLSVQKAAGAGYRLSFYVMGTAKECLPNMLRGLCQEWENSRNNGGMGGYHLEVLGPAFTIVPDRILLTPFGDRSLPLRSNEELQQYRISVYDSVAMNSVRAEILSRDGLRITVGLLSPTGVDITATSLIGTKTQTLIGGIAEFKDLSTRNAVGLSFTLVFAVSWRDRCVNKLIDEGCSGVCCIKFSLDIFPNMILVRQPETIPLITEGDIIANFSIISTDFFGNVFSQVGSDFGLQTQAFLQQRGIFVNDKILAGQTVSNVDGGVSNFSDLRIMEHAGRDMRIYFRDDKAQIVTQSVKFDVFPRSIAFEGILGDAESGGPMRPSNANGKITIKLLSSLGNVLTSSIALDQFIVEVYAAGLVEGEWNDCRCLEGPNTSLAENGIATFDPLLLRIPRAIGAFTLHFRLPRPGLLPLAAKSNSFEQIPQGIYMKSSALKNEVFVGDVLGLMELGFLDASSVPILTIAALSSGSFEVFLLQDSMVLATHYLAGTKTKGVINGSAAFGDLRVDAYAGTSLRIKFVFTSIKGTANVVYELTTSNFTVRPARLGINNTLPNSVTDLQMPSLNVSLKDSNGSALPVVKSNANFIVTIELYTARSVGCTWAFSFSDFIISSGNVSWEQCAQHAILTNAPTFVTGRNPLSSRRLCGIGTARLTVPATFDRDDSNFLPAHARFNVTTNVTTSEASTYLFYQYSGEQNPTIYIDAGSTISFTLDVPGHPFMIRLSGDGENIDTGLTHVSTNGTVSTGASAQGQVEGTLYWQVPFELANKNYVYQSNYSGMVGRIEIRPAIDLVCYSITNSTASMIGTKRQVVHDGWAQFSGLRVTGLYGIKSFFVAVRNRGNATRDLVELTQALTIDPINWRVIGLPNASIILSQPLPETRIMVTDSNGNKVSSIVANEVYVVEIALLHAGVQVNHRLGLPHSQEMPASNTSFSLRFYETGGSNFSIRVSMKMQNSWNSLLATAEFILFPDQLTIVGPQGPAYDAIVGSSLQLLQVRCEDVNGTLLSDIQSSDSLLKIVVGAAHHKDSTALTIPACSDARTTACLNGSINVQVENGSAAFSNLNFVGLAGRLRLNFGFEIGGPTVWTSPFVLLPAKVFISEGEYMFRGVSWIINKGLGDYAVSARGSANEVLTMSSDVGFINVSLQRGDGLDLTEKLQGNRSRPVNYIANRLASAIFTDLVVTAASGNLKLYFTLFHPNSNITVVNSTRSFRAVPYALRIAQKCFNGEPVNENMPLSSIPYGVPLLQCVGQGSLGRDFGRFGYLTGYYRYEDNFNLGPLLSSARGSVLVPPIDVLAVDLFLKVQTHIQAIHALKITAKLFVGEEEYTRYIMGNTVQVVSDGVATFQGLEILPIPACSPNCTLRFLFSLDGMLCSQTWCTNVTMTLRDATFVAPHRLGSHPGFPGKSDLTGTILVPCIETADDFNQENQEVFKKALLAASGVPYLTLDSITLLSPFIMIQSPKMLNVRFRFTVKSYTASNMIMSSVTDQFREGTKIIQTLCSSLGINSTQVKICGPCIETPKLMNAIERTVFSSLVDGRIKKPRFRPPGLPEGTCLRGEWAQNGTCSVGFGPFQEFDLLITAAEAGEPVDIFYTLDTCPVATAFCNTTGSVLSSVEKPVSNAGRDEGLARLKVFSTIPTQSLTPDGFFNNTFVSYFLDDDLQDKVDERTLKLLPEPLLQSGRLVGIRGNRQTMTMPLYLTVKAFGRAKPGHGKVNSFPVSTTFMLEPQALTPEVNLFAGKVWVLGWCNATHSSIPKANLGDPFIRPGNCSDIQHTNDSSVCTGADAVPCRLNSVQAFCTSGSKSFTIMYERLYDGTLVRSAATTTLKENFVGGSSTIKVASVAALGFTNEGKLKSKRRVFAICEGRAFKNDDPCTDGLFVVLEVSQSDNSLLVEYDHNFNYDSGITISLNETCAPSMVHQTIIFPMWTRTKGARIYYEVPGVEEPNSASIVLGSENSLALSVFNDTSLRAVAAGEKLMNSPHLHMNFTRPCGNGFLNGGEQCDDGNQIDGDECSSECMFERTCSNDIWKNVGFFNIGINFTGTNSSYREALTVSQKPSPQGLTSDCADWGGDTITVTNIKVSTSGGNKKLPPKITEFGRFADSGCAVTVGSDIFFANNFLFALENPDKTAGKAIFSYNVVTEMFTYDKYKFAYGRDQTACQSSGYSAYFAGGIKRVYGQGGDYAVNDEVDQLEIIPSLTPGQESTFKFHYAKYKLSKGRSYLASASVGHVIAFAGGIDLYGSNAVYDNFDVLNVTSGKMSTFKMPTGRYLHACSSVVNLIVCAGGYGPLGILRSVDIYDTSLQNFTSIPNGLSLARGLLAAGSSNTSVFFAGGFGDAAVPLANVDMFDFGTRTMRVVTPLREARYLPRGLSQVAGKAVFSGGRRRSGAEPLASKVIEIYDGTTGNASDSNLEMETPRFYHFAGVANGIGVFAFGISTDFGFASPDQWVNAETNKFVDVVDLGPLTRKVRAELQSADSGSRGSKTVQLPFYHIGTRIFLDIPFHETRFDESASLDSWTLTCLPGFRKSQYQVMKETTLYSAFLCVCTNVTNFFKKSALFPSDQAVMLRVPLSEESENCGDICMVQGQRNRIGLRDEWPPAPKNYQGLVVQYTGKHPVDNLKIKPLTANKFCNGTTVATVKFLNISSGDGSISVDVVTTPGMSARTLTLPADVLELDINIDMDANDAQQHDLADTWTLKCGGIATGYASFSFPLLPRVCSVIVSPFY